MFKGGGKGPSYGNPLTDPLELPHILDTKASRGGGYTHMPVNSTSPANPEFGAGACYSITTELPLRAGADPDLQPWSEETACLTPARQSLSIKPSCVPLSLVEVKIRSYSITIY